MVSVGIIFSMFCGVGFALLKLDDWAMGDSE